MPPYVVEGFAAGRQPVREQIWAAGARDAVARANRLQITVTRIRLDWRGLAQYDLSPRKPSAAALAAWCQQFGAMVKAGIPVLPALRTLADLVAERSLRLLTVETASAVEQGQSLGAALERHAALLPPELVQSLAAAELSGQLERTLGALAASFERSATVRRKVAAALAYPTVVLILAIVALSVMLTLVLPRFTEIYRSMNDTLPAATLALLAFSGFVRAWGWALPLAAVVAGWGIRFAFRRSLALRRWWAALVLKAPIIGPIHRQEQSTRFIRTFSILVAGGLPTLQALSLAGRVLTNSVLAAAVQAAVNDGANGRRLAPAFRNGGLFPRLVTEMVAVGEETGSLETMMQRAADHGDQELQLALDRTTAVLEPLLIALLTVAVGSVLIPMLLPLLSLGQNARF